MVGQVPEGPKVPLPAKTALGTGATDYQDGARSRRRQVRDAAYYTERA